MSMRQPALVLTYATACISPSIYTGAHGLRRLLPRQRLRQICVYLIYYCTVPNLLLRLVIQVLKAFAAFFRASVGGDRSVPASSEAGKKKKLLLLQSIQIYEY